MKRMEVEDGSKALDICCGTGDWSIALSEAVGESGEVVGLAFSKNMLSVAAEKKEELQLNNTQFIHGNAMEIPFGDNSLDYVTIGFGLRNVLDDVTVLNAVYRVVEPGRKCV